MGQQTEVFQRECGCLRIFCSRKGQPTGLCTAATVGTACTNQSGEITLSGNTHTECSVDKLLHFQSNCTDCLNFRASHFSGDNDTGKSVFFCPDCTRWGTDGHLCGGMQRHFRNPLMNIVGNAQILYNASIDSDRSSGLKQFIQRCPFGIKYQCIDRQIEFHTGGVAEIR